jgi:two-component system, LuxR family, response regulator FixJ
VVDDHAEMLSSLREFLIASGILVETFSSAAEFLTVFDPDRPGCLILDIQMPGMSGIELQEVLDAKGVFLPTIVVSGNASCREVVRTMKLGSLDFLEKPYAPDELLEKVREAFRLDQRRREEYAQRARHRARYEKLSPREKEILSWVVSGYQSKVIADKVGLRVSTVDNHRANIMKKLGAATSADLTRIALIVDPGLAFSP